MYAADGTTAVGTLLGTLNASTREFTLRTDNPASTLAALTPGAHLRLDNRWYLAAMTYARRQVPTRSGFTAFDQYRNADGTPKFPQRPFLIGGAISGSVSGGNPSHTGKINAKVIQVCNLLDAGSYPWACDWYGQQVKQSLGNDAAQSNYRLWYNDHADHFDWIGARTPKVVDYNGVLQQALRDVSAWVETNQQPPASTNYTIKNGQVGVPSTAAVRRGVQPVADVTAITRNGIGHDNRPLKTKPGERVSFVTVAQAPPGPGKIISAEWDPTGSGQFTPITLTGKPQQLRVVTTTFSLATPGVYYPTIRITSERNGDLASPFARVQNLDSVRVIVG